MAFLTTLCVWALLFCSTLSITASCPTGCYCNEPDKTVSCTGAGITEIPKNIPGDTRFLAIGFTSITTIMRGDFRYLHKLDALDLSNNKITAMETGAFEGLENMTSLSVNNNPDLSLPSMDPTIFQDLHNITYFYGQNNSLEVIPSMLFKKSGRLWQILMDHSGITELQPGSFANLSELKMLDLSNNLIKSIANDVFTGSWKLESLFLESNKLLHVDQGAFSTQGQLQFLILDHNMLESVDGVFEGLHQMVSLTLSNNMIRTMKNGTFKDTETLHSFDISNNELEDTEGALQDLGDLAQINLSNNHLTKLSFKGMPYLSDIWVSNNSLRSAPTDMDVLKQVFTMDISSNPIENLEHSPFKDLPSLLKLDISNTTAVKNGGLEEGTFTGLDSLIELWLERNDLTSIPAKAFCSVSQIQVLNLNQNLINSTHEEDFVCLQNLTKLQLAENRLTEVPKGIQSLQKLARLDLSQNQIVRIPKLSFSNLPNLIDLDISNEHAILVEAGAFNGLDYMETLNLTGNKLRWLPRGSFKSTSFSEKLDLKDNSWTCDCQLKGFARDLKSGELKNFANIICAEPEQYRGRNLTDIPLANLTCNCDHPAAPSVDTSGSDNQTAVGNWTTLKCAVRSCPEARVFWTTPRGVLISFFVTQFGGYDVREDGTLVIVRAVPEDAGEYTCTAVNYMGKDTMSHFLRVV